MIPPAVDPPTVNVAVAMLLLESITVTVWFPARPAGMFTNARNAPAPFGPAVAGTVLTIVVPTSTTIAEYGVKLFPIISTVEPTGPVVGVRVIVGGVMAKVAFAVFPAVSVTLTVLLEVAVNGTAKFVEMVPPDPVVPVFAAIATKAPLTVTLKDVPDVAKPAPVM